jgi:hypothetical protein
MPAGRSVPLETQVQEFFDTYAHASGTLDQQVLASCFPEEFLVADDTGARAVPLSAFLQALPRRAQMFADAGIGPPVLGSVTCQQLDKRYVLARTHWTAPRTTSGDPVHLSSSFLLRHGDDGFRIVAYLTHQGLPAPDTAAG